VSFKKIPIKYSIPSIIFGELKPRTYGTEEVEQLGDRRHAINETRGSSGFNVTGWKI
jgi:hypothetical protein